MKYILSTLLILVFTSSFSQQKLYSDSAYKKVAPYVDLQEAVADTGNVTKLILKKKKYTKIPSEIFNMIELEYLDLSKNKIDTLPADLGKLKNLRVLILGKNKLSVIPLELYQLEKLKILDLSSNDISELPEGLSKLKALEELNLWNTSVDKLPEDIMHNDALKLVDMRGILLNYEAQEEVYELLPNVKVYMSPPCNCSF